MKRSLLSALVIGLIAGGIVMGLHRSGMLAPTRTGDCRPCCRVQRCPHERVGETWQYVFVFILAAAWPG